MRVQACFAPESVVRLGREQPGLKPGAGRQRGEAGLGGGVAFGVNDVDVPAPLEGELGQAQERFSLPGAGEADQQGA